MQNPYQDQIYNFLRQDLIFKIKTSANVQIVSDFEHMNFLESQLSPETKQLRRPHHDCFSMKPVLLLAAEERGEYF